MAQLGQSTHHLPLRLKFEIKSPVVLEKIRQLQNTYLSQLQKKPDLEASLENLTSSSAINLNLL